MENEFKIINKHLLRLKIAGSESYVCHDSQQNK